MLLTIVNIKLTRFLPAAVFRCDNEDDWVNWKDHCYHFSPKGIAKTWHDARVACQDMGGDLASITTKGENDFIEAVIWQGGRVNAVVVFITVAAS